MSVDKRFHLQSKTLVNGFQDMNQKTTNQGGLNKVRRQPLPKTI